MNIALIAPTQLPARRANTVQVMKMAQAFIAIGHQVVVLAPNAKIKKPIILELEDKDSPGKGLPAWDDLARHYGLKERFKVIWLPVTPKLRSYDYALRAVIWARKLQAEWVYTRLPQAAALASQVGYPTIYEVHDMILGRSGPILMRLFLRGSGAQKLVVITQALLNDLSTRFIFPNRNNFAIVAPDGVDLARYESVLPSKEARTFLPVSLGESQFVAGYTGHLYAGRGVELILSLAGQLKDVVFLLVGGEPEAVRKFRLKTQEASLQNVVLLGFVPNAELPNYQAACDVLLMPYQPRVSASSGGNIASYLSPMKMFEYLAAGRPVLASALPVLQEVLHMGNSVLLPPENVDAWVSAITDLRLNPAKMRALAAQGQHDAKRYTWNARAGLILGDHIHFS